MIADADDVDGDDSDRNLPYTVEEPTSSSASDEMLDWIKPFTGSDPAEGTGLKNKMVSHLPGFKIDRRVLPPTTLGRGLPYPAIEIKLNTSCLMSLMAGF